MIALTITKATNNNNAPHNFWQANNLTIANLQPKWTHCIFTWYMSVPKHLYQVAVHLINGLNRGQNFWENLSRWIGDIYYAFMLPWNTAT